MAKKEFPIAIQSSYQLVGAQMTPMVIGESITYQPTLRVGAAAIDETLSMRILYNMIKLGLLALLSAAAGLSLYSYFTLAHQQISPFVSLFLPLFVVEVVGVFSTALQRKRIMEGKDVTESLKKLKLSVWVSLFLNLFAGAAIVSQFLHLLK